MILPDDYIDKVGAEYIKHKTVFTKFFDTFHEYLINAWLLDCGGVRSRKFIVFHDGDLVEHTILQSKMNVISMVVGDVLVDENGVPVCTVLMAESPQIVGHVTNTYKGRLL